MTEIIAIDTPTLGDRSYLAHDGTVAVVIDPQRDIDRVLDLAASRGVTITHLFETQQDWAAGQPLRRYPVADFAALAAVRHHRPVTVLDVRRKLEWAASHLEGAVHLPLHDLPDRLAEVPAGEVWVHCEAGYRAAIAASILDAAGRTVVAVDDEYGHAAQAGLSRTSDTAKTEAA